MIRGYQPVLSSPNIAAQQYPRVKLLYCPELPKTLVGMENNSSVGRASDRL
ncbi:hypothetical protein CIHG_07463 [Coccidioides immitis H538.4]|uniref:Uncharacterized protein n=3 Tax=Coccidioides immitis TaxID=5501 RepID=A0A0J8U2N3_COCIT|nr:hypothetical protein CIRG_02398 [Coccidioides immitis RMSCC 2394]KMU80917.1 hypothetical protein CISG_08813 [Coccidioides immitis RMSCC 3703]KMU89656.1 hypothetical protein CIHG_07463 [Coccidioides immitis H538.4]